MKITKLDPPHIYNGDIFSHAVLFEPVPSNNNGYDIVEGKIHSVIDLGDKYYRIICERGIQQSSYTQVIGLGQGGIEVSTSHSCGGNICAPQEIDRVLSYNNEPMSSIGSLEAIRAVPGDGIEIIRAGRKYLWEIVDSRAYGAAPSSVNYNGDDSIPTIGFIYSDIANISIPVDSQVDSESYIPRSSIFFDETIEAPYLSGLSFINDANLFTQGIRVYKDEPLPSNFGIGLSGPNYYYDDNYSFRVSSDAINSGDRYFLQWMLKGTNNLINVVNGNYIVVKKSTNAQWQEVADNLALSGTPNLGDFDFRYSVYQACALHWRESTRANARSVRMEVDGSGGLSAFIRGEEGGAFDVLSISQDSPLSFPCQLRLELIGNVFYFYSRQDDSGVWELNASDSIGSEPNIAGICGLVPIDRDFGYIINQDMQEINLYLIGEVGDGADTYIYRSKIDYYQISKRHPKPSPEPILSVFNVSSNQSMSLSSDIRQRNTYDIDNNDIIIFSESDGDIIRVITQASTTPPVPPGLAPRNFLQPGFSEYAGDIDNPRLASTNVSNNKANWRDYIDIYIDDIGFIPVAGETFNISRGRGVWSVADQPIVYIDIKNDDTSDWQAITISNYHLRRYQGLLLLKKSFMDNISKDFCIKVEGRRYRSGADAEIYNNLDGALNILPELYVQTAIVGGHLAETPSGESLGMSILYGGFNCSECGWQPSEAHYGTLADDIRRYLATTPPRTFPFWYAEGATPAWATCGTNISDPDNPLISCGEPPYEFFIGTYDYVIPEEEILLVYPYSKEGLYYGGIRSHWQRENYRIEDDIIVSDPAPSFDNYLIGYIGNAGSFVCDTISSAFAFEAIPIQIPSIIQRMPDDIIIIDAKLSVKFGGFRQRSLSGYYYIDPDDNNIRNWEYYEQGQLAISYEKIWNGTSYDETSFDNGGLWADPSKGGTVSFGLVGKRKSTQYVYDWAGNQLQAPEGELISLGGTVSSNVEDGKWSIVDATGLVRAMIAARKQPISQLYLYPSNAAFGSEEDPSAMASYLRSLRPEHSVDFLPGELCGAYGIEAQASSKITWWSSLELGSLQIRFSLPNGLVQQKIIQFREPPAL
jgi:hypothetical protein